MKSIIASIAVAAAVAGVISTLMLQPTWVRAEERVEVRSDAGTPSPMTAPGFSSPGFSHAQALAGAFKQIARQLDASVVQIDVSRRVANAASFPGTFPELEQMFPDTNGDGQPDLPPGFRVPWGFQLPRGIEPSVQGEGSGFVIDFADGFAWVVTNNHVAADAKQIAVTFANGQVVKGDDVTLVGADPRTDVALLRVKTDSAVPVRWGDSDKTERGDIVLAFGSPFGYTGSVSQGIISAKGREVGILRGRQGFENFIQTDAAINPGNSGGPLVNLDGEVIGINTAIASRTGGFNGIGFAIPSNQAKDIVDRLRRDGRVVRGFLGIRISDIELDPAARQTADELGFKPKHGVLVASVSANSPALNKLEPDDIITQFNGKDITSMREFRELIAATPPKTQVTLKVWRKKDFKDINIVLGESPEEFSGVDPGQPTPQEAPSAVRLGVSVEPLNPDNAKEMGLPEGTKGLLVKDVTEGSIAQRIGLAPGDVITRVNGTEVSQPADLARELTPEAFKQGIALRIVNKDGVRVTRYRANQ